jgi:ribosomal protein S27AE
MIVHGDALKIVWDMNSDGASILFLNPPYEEKSLEFEFVERYVQCLAEHGILVLIVPYKSLDRLASLLARTCENIRCFRFPTEFFKAFGQVVVFAQRRSRLSVPDPIALSSLLGWWRDPTTARELPATAPYRMYQLPTLKNAGFDTWAIASADIPRMLAQVKPWHTTDRGGKLRLIPGIAPTRPIHEMLERRYLLAMPPKQAHIAGALASGVFNGAVVKPNDASAGLPKLLVNGVFQKISRLLEEKVDGEGEKKAEIRVEAPKLIITVLDLDRLEFHTLPNDPLPTGTKEVGKMNAADFIESYGRGLLDVMRKQCPVVHDPDDPSQEFPLPDLEQPLFRVQRHAVMALVKLLGGPNVSPAKRRNLSAGLDGEMGTGKTRMGAMVARVCGAKRVVVMCPTHLLTTWPDEISAVVPNAKIVLLDDVEDVDRFFNDKHDGMLFGILSKETAKLSHTWVDVGEILPSLRKMCPRCGTPVVVAYDGELAAKRVRCSAQCVSPKNNMAKFCQTLAITFLPFTLDMPDMWSILTGRNHRNFVQLMKNKFANMSQEERLVEQTRRWDAVRSDQRFAKTIQTFAKLLVSTKKDSERDVAGTCLSWLMHACDDMHATIEVCKSVYEASLEFVGTEKGRGEELRSWVRDALLRVDFDRGQFVELVEKLRAIHNSDITLEVERSSYGYGRHSYSVERNSWDVWTRNTASVRRGETVNDVNWHAVIKDGDSFIRGSKVRVWDKVAAGSIECAVRVVAFLYKHSAWTTGAKCNEPLFQAVPDPRRYPLANFIARRYGAEIGFYICDEVHEMAGDGTAQSFAFHQLATCGAPSLFMTGTWMNGKAESLFNVQWQMDPEFRQEFGFLDRAKFKDIFGYKKVEVSYRDKETRKIVAYGSSSDRVELVTRDVGDAPGILPIFLPRFLLRRVVVVHKAELDKELPPLREFVETIDCDKDQLDVYQSAANKLLAQIISDRRDKEKAGQLLGALFDFQTQPDRCTADTGNAPDGAFEIRYPVKQDVGKKRKAKRKKNEVHGGELFLRLEPQPTDRIMPKEARVIEIVKAQLARGRNCMVFGWHERVLPRLARIIEEAIGEKVALLETDRVEPYKRKEWINKNVIALGIRVLVVSPAAVQTGLNNLIAFPTQIWTANPGVNPTIYRQARDRSHRIGQTQEVEIYFLLYAKTAQVGAHKLLVTKVGVAMSTDGLDARSVLLAAGIGESDTFDLLSVGKQLYLQMVA